MKGGKYSKLGKGKGMPAYRTPSRIKSKPFIKNPIVKKGKRFGR